MKRFVCVLFILTLFAASVFADKKRFYENGKVIDTMYVDAEDGLRVRDFPSLISNRLCALPHRLAVKIVAIGKEETIDGITAPWVEILLPLYEWKGDEPKYGWVYGGYLSKEQPKFFAPKNAAELEKYLVSVEKFAEYENNEDKKQYYVFYFSNDGRFRHGVDESGIGQGGEWAALSKNTVRFHTTYVGEEYKDDRIWELEFVFENDGSFHYHERGVDFYCYPSFSNSNNASLYSVTSKGNFITWYDVRSERWNPNDPIDEYVKARIKWGISAKGTKFEGLYRDYWDPIMKEHQEKADAIK